MNRQADQRPVVVIIGGGVSGAGVAYHLAKSGCLAPGHIVVFEPRSKLGAGLAYDTQDPAHRINVPAARMSLLPDDQEHFQRWIEAGNVTADDPAAQASEGRLFPRRGVFGDYLNAMVRPFVESGAVRHIAARVGDVVRQGDGWLVSDEAGGSVQADIVVIATSHPAPTPPASLVRVLAGHPGFVPDPTRFEALDGIGETDRVLIVGNGLTSADIIASLTLRGHRGDITAISRRGLRSRGHAVVSQEPYGDFVSAPAKTALALLKQVRATVKAAEADGVSWHAVIDQVRTQGHDLWQALPVVERRRIVRHLRPFWDVHRFRVAPQVEKASEDAIESGRLTVLAASIRSVTIEGDEIDCVLRLSRSGETIERRFDAVVVTTGPGHRAILESQPWIAKLADEDYLALDATGLGLACNTLSRALGASGRATPSLVISGPLARGTFGELMGLPQVSEHALFVAEQILDEIALTESNSRPNDSAA